MSEFPQSIVCHRRLQVGICYAWSYQDRARKRENESLAAGRTAGRVALAYDVRRARRIIDSKVGQETQWFGRRPFPRK